jgi:hypothetical protein
MTVSVKLAWIILAGIVALVTVGVWKNPKAAVPLAIGIAAAAALTPLLHL